MRHVRQIRLCAARSPRWLRNCLTLLCAQNANSAADTKIVDRALRPNTTILNQMSASISLPLWLRTERDNILP
jgi:hypothetical protein